MVFAQAAASANPCTIKYDTHNNITTSPSDLPLCISQVYIWSLGVGALLAFLMMVIGGYNYMTASGNAEQSGKGVEMIWGSIIGLALLFGAYLLLSTINPDLVNFSNFTNDFNGLNSTSTSGSTNTNSNSTNSNSTSGSASSGAGVRGP